MYRHTRFEHSFREIHQADFLAGKDFAGTARLRLVSGAWKLRPRQAVGQRPSCFAASNRSAATSSIAERQSGFESTKWRLGLLQGRRKNGDIRFTGAHNGKEGS